jgi:para-nitrobenzyl esterase
VVLPASPLELLAAQAAPPPMLLGSNREEAVFDLAQYVVSGEPYPLSAWVRDTKDLVGPQNGAEARNLYPLESFDSALWSTIGLFTDAIYTCPIRQLAFANGGPVYRYLFTHQYQNDPVAAAFRAAHFFDDPLLWHDSTLLEGFLGRPNYQFSAQEEALSARMAAYWTNFAKTGDPNGAGLPPWPLYTSTTERITVLDEPAAEIAAYQMEECAFLDRLPALFAGASVYTPSRSPVPR